jgi:hypothetical protein
MKSKLKSRVVVVIVLHSNCVEKVMIQQLCCHQDAIAAAPTLLWALCFMRRGLSVISGRKFLKPIRVCLVGCLSLQGTVTGKDKATRFKLVDCCCPCPPSISQQVADSNQFTNAATAACCLSSPSPFQGSVGWTELEGRR